MKALSTITASVACLALAASLSLTGCGEGANSGPQPQSSGAVSDHAHSLEGPHHGSLIELGNEEYHAELVHNEQAGTVAVYILDSTAKHAVPIDAKELTITLSHEGDVEYFKLSAVQGAADPSGRSSLFTSANTELAEELDHEHAEAQLVVIINGKQFRGAVVHDHDHEGHDHNE